MEWSRFQIQKPVSAAQPGVCPDLLIIDSIPFGPDHNRRRTLSRTRKALHQFLFPVDLLLYSRDEIEYWKDAPNHVVSRALREGRVLYERH